jgi:hypothetical protein
MKTGIGATASAQAKAAASAAPPASVNSTPRQRGARRASQPAMAKAGSQATNTMPA